MNDQNPEDATVEEPAETKQQSAARRALADQSAAAKAAKDVADAQAAAANAQKARSEAELAAAKARFGEIPASGYTGAVELGTGAGSAECMLLGALALNEIAEAFAAQITRDAADCPLFLLTTEAGVPDFQALTAFELQVESFRKVVAARRKIDASTHKNGSKSIVESTLPVAVGLGLEAVDKLLAFAKTDYKFIGVDVASSDAMLISALAGRLRAENVAVEAPSLYSPVALDGSNAVLKKASEVFEWSIEAKYKVMGLQAQEPPLEKSDSTSHDDQKHKGALNDPTAAWNAISDAIDAWMKRVTTADDKGVVPLATIARQSAIKRKLDEGAALVVVQLHKVAGTAYTKKNLWSSLGCMPFFVMGGAVAGYVAFDGKSGQALSSLLLPAHGGYTSVSKVKDLVDGAVSKAKDVIYRADR